MNKKFFHSVYLDESLCKGCINCIKRCPTQAIRVRNGKARITSQFCIDCGECVRTCSHHAKKIHIDSLDILNNYAYTVALPAPSLYAQFNNLDDVNILLTALIYLGFDDVYEVGAAAELVSEASRKYVDKIGIIFISPCPSKVTYVKSPLGTTRSEVNGVLAVKDVYPLLLPHMKIAEQHPMDLAISGRIGIGWGCSGGEAGGMITDSYLAADGIENVIRVLEDLEDEKFAVY